MCDSVPCDRYHGTNERSRVQEKVHEEVTQSHPHWKSVGRLLDQNYHSSHDAIPSSVSS